MKFYLNDIEKKKIRDLGFLTTSQVAYFLKVSPKTVRRLIKEKRLKASVFKFYKRKTFLIAGEELIRFVDSFKNMLSPFCPK